MHIFIHVSDDRNFCAWCGDDPTGEGLTPAAVLGEPCLVCFPCAEGLAAETDQRA